MTSTSRLEKYYYREFGFGTATASIAKFGKGDFVSLEFSKDRSDDFKEHHRKLREWWMRTTAAGLSNTSNNNRTRQNLQEWETEWLELLMTLTFRPG